MERTPLLLLSMVLSLERVSLMGSWYVQTPSAVIPVLRRCVIALQLSTWWMDKSWQNYCRTILSLAAWWA